MKRRRTGKPFDDAFEALLSHLDPDRDVAGEKYETLRRRLIQLLSWRGSWRPEELADEVLSRAGRTICEGDSVRSLEAYCAGIARILALEDARKQKEVPLEGRHENLLPLPVSDELDPRSLALDECLSEMTPANRSLVLQYYGGKGGDKILRRKGLAQDLGIPLNALRIRAYRIRAALHRCIHAKTHRKEDL